MYVYACVCKYIVEEREHANKHNGYLLGEGEGIIIRRGYYTHTHIYVFSSFQFSHSVVSDSL